MGPLSVGETIVRVKQPCRYDLFELYRLVHENNIHVHLRAIVPSFVGVMIIMDNLHRQKTYQMLSKFQQIVAIPVPSDLTEPLNVGENI